MYIYISGAHDSIIVHPFSPFPSLTFAHTLTRPLQETSNGLMQGQSLSLVEKIGAMVILTMYLLHIYFKTQSVYPATVTHNVSLYDCLGLHIIFYAQRLLKYSA